MLGTDTLTSPFDLLLDALLVAALTWIAHDLLDRRRITRPRPRLLDATPPSLALIGATYAASGAIDAWLANIESCSWSSGVNPRPLRRNAVMVPRTPSFVSNGTISADLISSSERKGSIPIVSAMAALRTGDMLRTACPWSPSPTPNRYSFRPSWGAPAPASATYCPASVSYRNTRLDSAPASFATWFTMTSRVAWRLKLVLISLPDS